MRATARTCTRAGLGGNPIPGTLTAGTLTPSTDVTDPPDPGSGEGDGLGVGVGGSEGSGVGLGDGSDGLGVGTGEGDGDGLGEGEGDGAGAGAGTGTGAGAGAEIVNVTSICAASYVGVAAADTRTRHEPAATKLNDPAVSSHKHPVDPESSTEYDNTPSPLVVADTGVTDPADNSSDVVGDHDSTWVAFDTLNVAETDPAAYRDVARVEAVTVHEPAPAYDREPVVSSHVHPVDPALVTAYVIGPSPVVDAEAGVTVAAGNDNAVMGAHDMVGVAKPMLMGVVSESSR